MLASAALLFLAIASSAQANVFLTSPTERTSWAAGEEVTLNWQESPEAPTLKDFGPAKIFLSTGNSIQQTNLQTISESIDVSTVNNLKFRVDPKIGPNGGVYFIRVESISFKDPKTPQFPALSFSARFALTGMTGTFSPAVQSQVDGTATAPIGGLPTAGATAGSTSSSTPAANTTPRPTTTTGTSTTGTGTARPAASSSAPPNAASPLKGSYGVALGALTGLLALFVL